MNVFLFYQAMILPYQLIFHKIEWSSLHITWKLFFLLSETLFFFDIIINLFTCYYSVEDKLVTNQRKIFFKYLFSYLLLDLVAFLPLKTMKNGYNLAQDYSHLIGFNKLLRIIKFIRMN